MLNIDYKSRLFDSLIGGGLDPARANQILELLDDQQCKWLYLAPVDRDVPKPGRAKDRIKIYLSSPHREQAEKIAQKMGLSLEALIERYICQMVADRRWPD